MTAPISPFRLCCLAMMVMTLACGDDEAATTAGSDTTEASTASTVDPGSSSSSADDTSTATSSDSSATSTGTEGTTGTTEGSDSGTAGTTMGTTADVRVLFLGNSYTQFNDMTGMVAQLATSAGVELEAVAITQGGATVADLLARRDVQAAVAEPGWDFVVIQGQSYEPLVQPMVFEDAALELAGLVSDAGAQPVFFETWARVAGHELYDQPWSGADPAGMQALLHAAYSAAADGSGGTLAPAGQGWALCLAGAPPIVLHAADGSHPSVAGSYLAAAVFHGVLSQVPAAGNGWWPAALSEAEATALHDCADAAVAAR